jgi:hypothetical protein
MEDLDFGLIVLVEGEKDSSSSKIVISLDTGLLCVVGYIFGKQDVLEWTFEQRAGVGDYLSDGSRGEGMEK